MKNTTKDFNPRREFLKQLSIGTASFSLGGLVLHDMAYGGLQGTVIKSASNAEDQQEFPPIFPIPQEANYFDDFFNLTADTTVLLPQSASEHDIFLAQQLVSELGEKYGIVLAIRNTVDLSAEKNYILMGTFTNPLVQDFASTSGIEVNSKDPGTEGYYLQVTTSSVVILGSDDQGAFYGLQSLRQLIYNHNATKIQCTKIKDWPRMPFRAIRLHIPGPENINFYKRLIGDFMALFKYNKVIIEVNGVMRLNRHPEINAGWIEFGKDLNYSRRVKLSGKKGEQQDSTHHDAGDGEILGQDQVADLVAYANMHHIETIPEIPSLSHVSYLLTRHRELAENPSSEWPDTYCPSNPESYVLLFDVLDEYIEVMKPQMINIGHDEWRVPLNVCERCKGKEYSELFIQDVVKIHHYLSGKNIRTAMWGDHLLESVRQKGPRTGTTKTGYTYQKPGALSPQQIKSSIPKDILILNWFWKEFKTTGEQNTKLLDEWGFEQVLGNFEPYISDFGRRGALKSIIGGAPSAWSATTEFNFGKNLLYKFIGCSNLIWSSHYHENERALAPIIQNLVPKVRVNLKGMLPPSQNGIPVIPLNIAGSFNTSQHSSPMGIPLKLLKAGSINSYGISFDVEKLKIDKTLCAVTVGNTGKNKTILSLSSKGIPVEKDVTSLIFLHTCAHPSTNIYGHNKIYSFADSADLLGFYRVVYQDGLVTSIPIRYGVNIREWHLWEKDPRTGLMDQCLAEPYCNGLGSYCYEADIVNCSDTQNLKLNFFSYEWVNPRIGVSIKEIYLEGSYQYRNHQDELIDNNAISLIALSCTTKWNVDDGHSAKGKPV